MPHLPTWKKLRQIFATFILIIILLRLGYVRIHCSQQRIVRPSFKIEPSRKGIVDQHGIPLAFDLPTFSLYVRPRQVSLSLDQLASQLAPILEISETSLLDTLRAQPDGVCFVTQMASQRARQIKELKIEGLELVDRPQRFYPQRATCANLLGYLDSEQKGQVGLENTYQGWLKTEGRTVTSHKDLYGQAALLADQTVLTLALDIHLQTRIMQCLEIAKAKYNAKRICAIVLDVTSGQIRALNMLPNFDPNTYYRYSINSFRNWPLLDVFEPGSTFKPINIAIALETNSIVPSIQIEDQGQIKIQDHPILNVGISPTNLPPAESLNLGQVLQKSSNVAMVKIMQQVAPTTYYDWLMKLGLGGTSCTSYDLPKVKIESVLKSRTEFCENPLEQAVASFGQGLAMSPMKLLQLIGSLANEGTLVSPHLVLGIFDPAFIPVLSKPISSSIWTCGDLVRQLLETVVLDEYSTGSQAFLLGHQIGGKTGTAQKASKFGGYQANAVTTSFVAIYPAQHPQYAILVLLDEPDIQYGFASNTAASLMQIIIATLVEEFNYKPTLPMTTISERQYLFGAKK